MKPAQAAPPAPSRIFLDPFGLYGATASRIGGLGGPSEPAHPTFGFHTAYLPLAGGMTRASVSLTGLEATTGLLVVQVNLLPDDALPPARQISQVRVPLAELAREGGAVQLDFEARAGTSYAIEGLVEGESDATAHALEIALQGGNLGDSLRQEITAARQAFLPGNDADASSSPALAAHGAPTMERPSSQMCTASQFDEAAYHGWLHVLGEPARHHRKQWEVIFILRTLDLAGMLQPGRRGLGFAVGREALPAIMAARGVDVLATDLPEQHASTRLWSSTDQHGCLEALRHPRYCPNDIFDARVGFRPVDMTDIPDDLAGFDFCWSACAYEHLGSLEAGLSFVERSLDVLRPGGVAVHTSEFNLTSNDATFEHPTTSLFRRRDMEELALRLIADGHQVARLNFDSGNLPVDDHVDVPPYQNDPHLKMALMRYATTSFGLVVRKGESDAH